MNASSNYLLKVDIKKAYDYVKWEFLGEILQALNFPDKLILWVMTCVTTASFSLSINGNLEGFFHGKRGLRQGDIMPPLPFVICMEYLSRILKMVGEHKSSSFHSKCRCLKFNHLVFADDLILFSKVDKSFVVMLMRILATFAFASGLVANNDGKSNI
ncbi:uncharacterized protein LOC110691165 [Chenopodium quinoa]|uniref:uncharacterized protein LOC110691165 n=1 Tax=Chenopodium quinoa TaxID=63459 RepID=UPI000B7831E7|nr:uncharacterized protein LOC110691165 [Chenopodium quinoa]